MSIEQSRQSDRETVLDLAPAVGEKHDNHQGAMAADVAAEALVQGASLVIDGASVVISLVLSVIGDIG